MSKVLDRKIEKEISHGLKVNYATGQPVNSYLLPKFEKNEKGEYVFVGNCTISNIKDYNKYLKSYREIAKYLKQTYRPVIAKIYRNALNSLVADNSKFRIEDNAYSLSSKLGAKPFTINTLQDNSASAYKQTLNFVTKAAFNSKRLKPCSEINELLQKDDKTLSESGSIFVLPVMTDNGVVLNQKKSNRTAVEAQFETIPSDDALIIKNYLLAATVGLEEENAAQIRKEIDAIFQEAGKIGESVRAGINNNLSTRLEKLTNEFVDLIGVDLSSYNKQPKSATRKSLSESEPSVDYDGAGADQDGSATNEEVNTFDADEILMEGSYKTSAGIENSKLVTKLSPEGMRFTVTMKNNKLFVANKEENSEEVNFEK